MVKCDTNPLTKHEHLYYIHPRLARHTPQTQGGTTTQGEHHPRPPRTQRPSPSQRAAHTPPHGSSESRHLLIPKAPAHPSPTHPGDGRSIDSKQFVGLRDQPTRRTIHPARSSQCYAHSPRIYEPFYAGLARGLRAPSRLHRRSLRRSPPTQRRK